MSESTRSVRVGTQLRSQVCSTTVIVIRPPSEEARITCGGAPMIAVGEDPDPALSLAERSPNSLGKRYTLPDDPKVELLVTKAGDGALAIDDRRLVVKAARALPSSD